MTIFLAKGDMDYVVAECKSKAQHQRLADVEFFGGRLEADEVFPMQIFPFDPVSEGVLTDFPCPPVVGTLVLSEKAKEALRPMLDASGALFSVESDEVEGYSLFVCDRFVDALDQERSELTINPEGRVDKVHRYALRADVLAGVDIFQMVERPRALFVSDKFVDIVSQHGLTGLMLKQVWSDTEGGVVIEKPTDPFAQYWRKDEAAVMRAKRKAMRAFIAGRR